MSKLRLYVKARKSLVRVLLIIAVLSIPVVSCIQTDKIDNSYKRTVLVYIGADNNLSNMSLSNIYSMNSSIRNENDNANLLVFVDRVETLPALLYIQNGKIDTLVKYPELDSTDPQVMREVIDYVTDNFESESYGLVLWSHGTGWLPTAQLHYVAPNMKYVQGRDDNGGEYVPMEGLRDPFADHMITGTKAFAWENRAGQKPAYTCMDMEGLVSAIPDGVFDFIAFDACYMGCVELIYALRHKARYIISSCYEIVSYGFPYHIVTRDLLNGNLMNICLQFHYYYNTMSGWERMGGISLVKTEGLDSLASCFGKIVDEYSESIQTVNLNSIQQFDRFDNHVFYDLEDFVDKLGTRKDLLTEFRLQLERCIPYKSSTPFIFHGDPEEIKVNTYCGLSVYIPLDKYEASGLNDDYRKTDWSKDTGYGVKE